jgi:hypothetical protein
LGSFLPSWAAIILCIISWQYSVLPPTKLAESNITSVQSNIGCEVLMKLCIYEALQCDGNAPNALVCGFFRALPCDAAMALQDTGSTLNHWPFPSHRLQEGYAYILTHPGTPCVFYDHLYQEGGLRQVGHAAACMHVP